jgi:anaerobic magnesium-protoporphyrin IX monomethyl ester cyclase
MNVCFVDPKGVHFGLNTGIGYIAAYVNKYNALDNIKVFDFNNNSEDKDARLREIASYDIIGFSLKSFTKDYALEIARKVKRKSNILIAGGPHITLDGINFIKEHETFDFGVAGEGEIATSQLLNALASDRAYDSIKGLLYRINGETVFTGNADRIANLDSLPYPDYSVFDSTADGIIQNYPLVTSRGCPYLCTYCCVKVVMGRTWVPRTVETVIDELKQAKQKYRLSGFNIQDDNFSLDMTRAKSFCDSLTQHDMNLKWSCPNGIRADKVDNELMVKMRHAGCFAVAMGIESGVEAEFKSIKKGEELSDIVKAVGMARRNKISVLGNFIIGLPGSHLNSIRESVAFAKKLKLEACIFNMFVPFPGTEVWDWVRDHGRLLMDWKDGFTQGKNPRVVFETDNFTKEERLQAYYEANIKCNNYFAFMDEHESVLSNILNVLRNIVRYDALNMFEHLFWSMKHSRRIIARIIDKTHK